MSDIKNQFLLHTVNILYLYIMMIKNIYA